MPIGLPQGKLVRDFIPDIAPNNDYILLNPEQRKRFTVEKLVEEAEEVQLAFAQCSRPALLEELADVMEVFEAIMKEHNISVSDLELARYEKRRKRGGFERGVYLIERNKLG